MSDQRCATVAIVGRPNVGKSTLLNALVGEKLAIATAKPQATRVPVVGLLTSGDTQLVLVDQPGLVDPSYLLHEAMRHAAVAWVRRADMLLHLHPAGMGEPQPLASILPELDSISQPVAIVLTKADQSERTDDSGSRPGDVPTFLVSANTGQGLDELIKWCRTRAPVRQFQYEADALSTQPERFFVTEFVREAAFELLGQELPYSLAAEVDEFRERTDPLYIRVTVFVERETQKRMVIGKGGRTVKRLGSGARAKIEGLLGRRVYLHLWVKTLPKWRSKPPALARFGFERPAGDLV